MSVVQPLLRHLAGGQAYTIGRVADALYRNRVTVGGLEFEVDPFERRTIFGMESIDRTIAADGDPRLFGLMITRDQWQGTERVDGWLETLRWFPEDHFPEARVMLSDMKTVLQVKGALLKLYPEMHRQIGTCCLSVEGWPAPDWTLAQGQIVQKICRLERITKDQLGLVLPMGIHSVGSLLK